jgi:uncharacterized protein (TIGR02099 family)
MRKLLAKILRWFVYFAAAGVMLLALLVGIARLLLPLVPEYQNEIKRWAGDATGLNVEFEYISASWPLAGPELKFFDVTVSTADAQPILNADYLTVGISLVRLVIDRELMVNRVGIGDTRLEIQNGPGGSFLFQGRPLEELLKFDSPPEKEFSLPDLRIDFDDTSLSFADIGRTDMVLDFFIEKLELRLSEDGVALDGRVQLDEVFGRNAELSLNLPAELLRPRPPASSEPGAAAATPAVEWKGHLAGTDLNVDRILEFWLNMEVPLQRTRGDIVIWAEFADLLPTNATVEIDLENIELSGPAGGVETYEAFRGQFEWGRNANGWVLGGSDLVIARDGRKWPSSEFTVVYRLADDGTRRITSGTNFLRLHDLYPMVLAVASEDVRDELLPRELSGDVSDFDLDLTLVSEGPAKYELEMQFDDLGIALTDDGESLAGISGTVVADQFGGRLQIESDDSVIELPGIFGNPLETESIDGFLIWRVTENQIRVLSDNIQLRVPFAKGNTRFELNWPRNGDSPRIDLTAFATISDAPRILRFLPTEILKPKFVKWLERSIVAGRVTGAQFELSGALREFPYDHGEGVFRVTVNGEDGIIDYAEGWPRAEDVSAQLVFDGVSFKVNRNRGRIGPVPFSGAKVHIDDLREGLLKISGERTVEFGQVIDFLRASPVADALGPILSKVQASGTLDTRLNMTLPIKRLSEYEVRLDAELNDASVSLEGLEFGFDALNGKVRVENTKVSADALTARLLGEPVDIRIWPANEAGGRYTHFATARGSTPVERWMEALYLPFPERVEGQVGWEAMALIPERKEERSAPPHILARSDLVGVTSTFPAPFDKTPEGSDALEIDIVFPEDGVLEVAGRLRKKIGWALRLEAMGDKWMINRGAVHAGAAAALLPSEPGIELSGRIETVRFDDWLALAEGDAESRWKDLYREADFNIGRLYLMGHAFPDVEIAARRDGDEWQINVDSPNLAGAVSVPLSPEAPIRADLERLWLEDEDSVDTGASDPRNIQSAVVRVDDFSMRGMRFGSLELDLTTVSFGIIADPIKTSSPPFSINGNAAWLVHPNDETIQQSQLRLDLQGNDIRGMLINLGYDPVIEGKVARIDADLSWAGAPEGEFLHRASGNLNVTMEQGALLELDPGGGRLLGVLSVAALPRRLSLDFSDVFDEGLRFDSIKGNFILNDGDAYTCNLSLQGSVADLGVVGRAGIAAEDYDQLAVVRPHVSNVLAIGGTVVGGPAVGAAMLLFSEIFKKPLSTLGESYYRVQGGWDNPDVVRIQGDELDLTPLKNCEQYLTAEIQRLSPE